MAVDTPVLERNTNVKVPSRMNFMEAEEHNARIRATYARLINPESKIEDVFRHTAREEDTAVVEDVAAEPVEEVTPVVEAKPYRVENARADSMIFRADSAINMRAETVQSEVVAAAPQEEENEDLMPTPTTIQYQTLGQQSEKQVASAKQKQRAHVFGKREKIIVAVFVAVVVALIALVLINSAVIANLNAEIAHVQDSITTVRGALAGVNGEIESIIQGALGQ